jgi:hypothetical protein
VVSSVNIVYRLQFLDVYEFAYQDRCFLLTIFVGSVVASADKELMTWYEISNLTDIPNYTRYMIYWYQTGSVP